MPALAVNLAKWVGGQRHAVDVAMDELHELEFYLSKNLFSWMSGDNRTIATGKVTSYVDKVVAYGSARPNARSYDPNHAFVQADPAKQVATGFVPLLGNREAGVFAGGQWYDSTLGPAPWKFGNDGSGFEALTVFTSGTNVNSTLWATLSGGTGTQLLCNGGSAYYQVKNGGSSLFFAAGGAPLNTATYADDSYLEGASPEYAARTRSVVAASGSTSGAPSTGNPEATFRIGANGAGGSPAVANIADIMIADQVSPTLRALAQRYVELTYGLAP